MNNLKRVELTIDDLEGSLDRISLVSEPAIEVDFFYFNKQKMRFKIENEEKRMITGIAMIPDMDIIRVDEKTGEYYNVWFSKDTVRKCAEMFFKKSDINSTNLEHEFPVNDVTVFESWIVQKEFGKGGGKNFEDATDGTWLVTMKVDNDVVWNDFIRTGIVKGLSIEGLFTQNFSKLDIYDQIVQILKDITED